MFKKNVLAGFLCLVCMFFCSVVSADDPLLVEMDFFHAVWQNDHIVVEWQTVSELDTAGFYLWRANKEGTKYEKITETMIASEGGITFGAYYSFQDYDVLHSLQYLYKLEEILDNGSSFIYGPVESQEVSRCGIVKRADFTIMSLFFVIIPFFSIIMFKKR